MEKLVLVIDGRDNVAVALRDIAAGTQLELPGGGRLASATDIPFGHKVALEDIAEDRPVIKYGEEIGRASRSIAGGEWVHTHNMGAIEVEN